MQSWFSMKVLAAVANAPVVFSEDLECTLGPVCQVFAAVAIALVVFYEGVLAAVANALVVFCEGLGCCCQCALGLFFFWPLLALASYCEAHRQSKIHRHKLIHTCLVYPPHNFLRIHSPRLINLL